MATITQNCPCCSGKKFNLCCEPLLLGKQYATTPEQLMRSRYSAFATRNIDYIFSTMTGATLKNTTRRETQAFIDHVTWTGLEVINSSEVDPNKQEGFVEFAAHFLEDDEPQILSEQSRFVKIDHQWFYIDGQHKLVHPENCTVYNTNKLGRNDMCLCGSGKKYKKCCLNKS